MWLYSGCIHQRLRDVCYIRPFIKFWYLVSWFAIVLNQKSWFEELTRNWYSYITFALFISIGFLELVWHNKVVTTSWFAVLCQHRLKRQIVNQYVWWEQALRRQTLNKKNYTKWWSCRNRLVRFKVIRTPAKSNCAVGILLADLKLLDALAFILWVYLLAVCFTVVWCDDTIVKYFFICSMSPSFVSISVFYNVLNKYPWYKLSLFKILANEVV